MFMHDCVYGQMAYCNDETHRDGDTICGGKRNEMKMNIKCCGIQAYINKYLIKISNMLQES